MTTYFMPIIMPIMVPAHLGPNTPKWVFWVYLGCLVVQLAALVYAAWVLWSTRRR